MRETENSLPISLRRVTEEHLPLLLEWRTRPEISSMLFTNPKLTMESQKRWYEALKEDPTQIRWIIYNGETPIGSIYIVDIDNTHKRCESGIFVAVKELSSVQLYMAVHWNMFDYVFNSLGLNRIYAYIFTDNSGVIKLSTYAGLAVEGILKQHMCKDGEFRDIAVVAITKDRWLEFRQKVHFTPCVVE